MSKYDLNVKRLALLLLPMEWRKPLIATITYAVVAPLGYLHTRFMQFRSDTNYRLTHNGQVCRLRAVLNDYFDPTERRITITQNGENGNEFKVWLREERRGRLMPLRETNQPIIISRRGLVDINCCDFWVNIPFNMPDKDKGRLKAIVNTYKLASKRYLINYT